MSCNPHCLLVSLHCWPLFTRALHASTSSDSVRGLHSSACNRADGVVTLGALLDKLAHVESFYDSIGGLIGYQRQCVQLLIANAAQPAEQHSSDSHSQQAQVG